MGLSLCSETYHEDIITDHFSEFEESDEELVDTQSIVHGRPICIRSTPNIKIKSTQFHLSTPKFDLPLTKSISEPSQLGPSHHNNCNRRRVEPSLRQRIQERNNHPIERFQGEDLAKQYSNTLEDSTWMHLSHTLSVGDSIVNQGVDISEELARQDGVIHTVNRDAQFLEVDLNETWFALNGMKSLRGKVSNLMCRKKPKVYVLSCEDDEQVLKLQQSKSVPANFPYRSPEETKQQQIKMGVKQLLTTMDTAMNQQLDIAETLQHQEGYLNEFESNMDRIHGQIHYETDIMNSIRMA